MIEIINYVIQIIIICIAMEKNEYIFSGIFALYMLIFNYFFYSFDSSVNIFLMFFLSFIIYYINALVAFKSTRLFQIENKLFFVVTWSIMYAVITYLTGHILQYILTLI